MLYEVVKVACSVPTSVEKIQKATVEGVNTLRLHDKDRRMQEIRKLDSRRLDNYQHGAVNTNDDGSFPELPQLESRSDHYDTDDNREHDND